MRSFLLLAMLVVVLAFFSSALSCMSSGSNDPPSGRPAVVNTTPRQLDDEDENSSEFSGHECGPVHGKCPYQQCCSLRNECGNSTSHCNLSLGCKKKWGVCH